MAKKEKILFNEAREYVLHLIENCSKENQNKLPTDRDITNNVTASYAVVRLVMSSLEEEGYLKRIRGSGTYITEQVTKLLKEEKKKSLLFFRPPYMGTKSNSYNEWICDELLNKAKDSNWKTTVLCVKNHDEFIEQAQSRFNSTDAIVYFPVTDFFEIEQLSKMKGLNEKPLVIVDFELSNLSLFNISTDNRNGGGLAAKHLLSMNHSKIGVLVCEPKLNQCRARIQGFTEMLDLVGIEPVIIDCNVKREDDRYTLAYNKMTQAIKNGLDITALFAVSDSGAQGAIKAIQDSGLSVPNDISIIGFDGLSINKEISPALTSIQQPVSKIAKKVFSILNCENDKMEYQTYIAPELSIEHSVRKLEAEAATTGKPLQYPTKTKPFTLIELMTVTSLIVLLMTLLVPALNTANEVLKKNTCSDNLRQIGIAESFYADDHGYYTPGRLKDPIDFHGHYWDAQLFPYVGYNTSPTSWDEGCARKQSGMFQCPSRENITRDTRSYAMNGFGYLKLWYGMTNIKETYSTEPYAPHKASPTSQSSKASNSNIMFLSELGPFTFDGSTYHTIRNGTFYNNPAGTGDTEADFRHEGYKNVLWFDFHVSQVQQNEMAYSNLIE